MTLVPALALLLRLAPCGDAQAATEVHINLAGQSADANLPSLGLPPFISADSSDKAAILAAKNVRDIVRQDLLLSRYVSLKEDGPHFSGENLKDLMRPWKIRQAGWLLTVSAGINKDILSLAVELTNLHSKEAVFARHYRRPVSGQRGAAHTISNDIIQAMTGKMGIAHTWIAFANNQTGKKEIYLIDYDGANLRRLTRHGSISFLPRFSPDRSLLAYTSYKDGNPDIWGLDLKTGKTKALSRDQGLNIAGGFSPDGLSLLMTLSRQKSPNLYVKNLTAKTVTQLTHHYGADSSPTFSPDAGQVAFVSDRSGNPQIYVLDTNTHRTKRLTNMNWCDSPSWSPTGEWIAFAGRAHRKDKIDIFLVDVTGSQIRQLTTGTGSNENPAWSPDGRFLVFTTTREGRSELYVMDGDGSAPRRVAELKGGSYTPAWSN